MKAHTKISQSKMTPDTALEFLQEGNHRFLQNLKST